MRGKKTVKKTRPLTEKDVQYAMEHLKEILVKTVVIGGRSPAEFNLNPSGSVVPYRVVESLLSDGNIVPLHDGLFPEDSQTFCWRHGK